MLQTSQCSLHPFLYILAKAFTSRNSPPRSPTFTSSCLTRSHLFITNTGKFKTFFRQLVFFSIYLLSSISYRLVKTKSAASLASSPEVSPLFPEWCHTFHRTSLCFSLHAERSVSVDNVWPPAMFILVSEHNTDQTPIHDTQFLSRYFRNWPQHQNSVGNILSVENIMAWYKVKRSTAQRGP